MLNVVVGVVLVVNVVIGIELVLGDADVGVGVVVVEGLATVVVVVFVAAVVVVVVFVVVVVVVVDLNSFAAACAGAFVDDLDVVFVVLNTLAVMFRTDVVGDEIVAQDNFVAVVVDAGIEMSAAAGAVAAVAAEIVFADASDADVVGLGFAVLPVLTVDSHAIGVDAESGHLMP